MLVKVVRNAAIVTAVCLVIGYPVAYFLAIKVKKVQVSFGLFIIALAPFFTSTLIRVEAWIPTMGATGAINSILQQIGIIHRPISILLFTDFAVTVALVQLLVLFMVTPIFFQLAALDRSAVEAARDLGASGLQVFLHVTLPLTRAGIMIGSVFVFVLAMGDFGTYRLIGGGQVGSIGLNIQNLVSELQYPKAAAQAAVLVVAMVIGVTLLLRFAKLSRRRGDVARAPRPPVEDRPRRLVRDLPAVPLRPGPGHARAVAAGTGGRAHVPGEGPRHHVLVQLSRHRNPPRSAPPRASRWCWRSSSA